mmetsp:Transcript_19673/g.44249  ORF Transcript_19673/g.44249 Transcript_19673/m.44249 type:complete len:213 (-) Transcript_19673:89-727(-)
MLPSPRLRDAVQRSLSRGGRLNFGRPHAATVWLTNLSCSRLCATSSKAELDEPIAKRDLYASLGLCRNANQEEISRAYKQMAKECHPDLRPDDPHAAARFKEVAEAYQTLQNIASRRLYNLDLIRREGHARKTRLQLEDPGGFRGFCYKHPVKAAFGITIGAVSSLAMTVDYLLRPGVFWMVFSKIPTWVPYKWWLADMYMRAQQTLGRTSA